MHQHLRLDGENKQLLQKKETRTKKQKKKESRIFEYLNIYFDLEFVIFHTFVPFIAVDFFFVPFFFSSQFLSVRIEQQDLHSKKKKTAKKVHSQKVTDVTPLSSAGKKQHLYFSFFFFSIYNFFFSSKNTWKTKT